MSEPQIAKVAEIVRLEAQQDYVGLWELHRLLEEHGGSSPTRIAQVVDVLLRDGSVDLGQFAEGRFYRWSEPIEMILARLESEMQVLNRPPDIGEIAWLVAP